MQHDEPVNPYAPPEARELEAKGSEDGFTRAERIRREHIKHEASIKSVGCLHILGGMGLVLVVLAVLPVLVSGAGRAGGVELGVVLGYAIAGAALLVSGFGLRRLAPWAKIPSSILCALGLIGFPIGTILNAYFLYLILGAKGNLILSDEYAEIVARTPHIKYVPWAALILIALLALGVLGMVAAATLR